MLENQALTSTLMTYIAALQVKNRNWRKFIDYAKAFDHVDHSIDIQKLLDLGVPKFLVRWLCSFLVERQQRVKFS